MTVLSFPMIDLPRVPAGSAVVPCCLGLLPMQPLQRRWPGAALLPENPSGFSKCIALQATSPLPQGPHQQQSPSLGLDSVLVWSTANSSLPKLPASPFRGVHLSAAFAVTSHCSVSPKSAALGVSVSALWVW